MNAPVRDATTVILIRDNRAVLMGQRNKSAVFMPGKFVFPGGAIDDGDATVPVTGLTPSEREALSKASAREPEAIIAAGIRELWEEAGLILGKRTDWRDPPKGWRGFAASGHAPDAAPLRYFFRAVTPFGRPRRFDARFLIADACDLSSDPDDFSRAEDELSHLQWIKLSDAKSFDLPFITQVVLAELIAHLGQQNAPRTIPFFQNDDERHLVSHLNGRSPLAE